MPDVPSNRTNKRTVVWWYAAEVIVYAVFVSAYLVVIWLVARGALKDLFDKHKGLYAIVALMLICVQGVLLEAITTALFRLIRRKKK